MLRDEVFRWFNASDPHALVGEPRRFTAAASNAVTANSHGVITAAVVVPDILAPDDGWFVEAASIVVNGSAAGCTLDSAAFELRPQFGATRIPLGSFITTTLAIPNGTLSADLCGSLVPSKESRVYTLTELTQFVQLLGGVMSQPSMLLATVQANNPTASSITVSLSFLAQLRRVRGIQEV
jgi:glycine/D-amino acid oxidase-like deaminating enzyme